MLKKKIPFKSEGTPQFCHMLIPSDLPKYLTVMGTEETGCMTPYYRAWFQLKPGGGSTVKISLLPA